MRLPAARRDQRRDHEARRRRRFYQRDRAPKRPQPQARAPGDPW
jgi:hypothetical protein